jgi:fumarate reductase subunit C
MRSLAQIGTITPPSQIRNVTTGDGSRDLSVFVSFLINLVLIVSAIIFLFMIIWGGVQWITSGGNKDKIAAARGRITHAVIGLAIVALAAVIAQTVGSILGFNIFGVSISPPVL